MGDAMKAILRLDDAPELKHLDGNPVRIGVERPPEEKTKFRYMACLERVAKEAIEARVARSEVRLAEVAVANDLVTSNIKTWEMAIKKEWERLGDEVVKAGLDDDNKIANVSAESLQEMLALSPQQLQERLTIPANTPASRK